MANWKDAKDALGGPIKIKHKIYKGKRYKLTARRSGSWSIWCIDDKDCVMRGDGMNKSVEAAMARAERMFLKIGNKKRPVF